MLTFRKNGYTKQEIFILKNVIQDAKWMVENTWAECDAYGEKCCKECYARTVCKDLQSLADYLESVENSVETVENQNP